MRRYLALAAIALSPPWPALASALPTADNSTGPSSDFVTLYYKLFWQHAMADANATSTATVKLRQAVPDEVTERLVDFSLKFEELPELLQLAVVWDSGYLLNSDGGTLTAVYTDCERAETMADIGLSAEGFQETQCPSVECSSAAGSPAIVSSACSSVDQLKSLVKCAAASTNVSGAVDGSPFWSTGDRPLLKWDAHPDLVLRQHTIASDDSILAIHGSANHSQVDSAATTTKGACSSASSVIVPCIPYSNDSAGRWCRPKTSGLLTRWLEEYAAALGIAPAKVSSPNEADRGSDNQLDDNGVIVNASFVYDGHSSDLAQQFYLRHMAGDEVDPLSIEDLPNEIQKRLDESKLDFSELSPLLQRALIWDSGFALGDDNSFVPIYSSCGATMAELALSVDDVQGAGCITQTCSANSTWRLSTHCEAVERVATASRCALDGTTTVTTSIQATVWENGGDAELIPNVQVRRWTSNSSNTDTLYVLDAGNTENTEAGCQARPAMVIPCAPYSNSTGSWCRPEPGALVITWLRQEARSRTKHGSRVSYILIPIIAVVVLTGAAVALALRHHVKFANQPKDGRRLFSRRRKPTSALTVLTPETTMCSHTLSPNADLTIVFSGAFFPLTKASDAAAAPHVDAPNAIEMLQSAPVLRNAVIGFKELQFLHLVGRGASGEVWLCIHRSRHVAAKRLTKRRREGATECFVSEMALLASLHHPNIIEFIGVASSTANRLWLVTEYMKNGDLHRYLVTRGDQLTWRREKLRIAVGIVQALCYLHHDLDPPVLHRDLKSKNVLLSGSLEAKLSDFGSSRLIESQREDLTEGVGTPYWTAPEVLQSREYGAKADIYSLGVVLTELDTNALPYADTKLTLAQILQGVMSGELQPTLSPDCPPEIAALARSCLQRDPRARPTAQEVLERLHVVPGGSFHTFSL